jgi:ribosomal protein S27E
MSKTSTEVICPDCGKVIAPEGAVENSRRCRCAELELSPSGSAGTLEPVSDAAGASSAAPVEKKCFVCGRDLAGRKRLKDHLGRYWCRECARADERAKRHEEDLRCPDCGRVFPVARLVYFQATRVCKTCFREREKELERKLLKSGIEKVHKKQEWLSIKVLAAIVVGLLLLAMIAKAMW